MKRLAAILLTVALILTGCGDTYFSSGYPDGAWRKDFASEDGSGSRENQPEDFSLEQSNAVSGQDNGASPPKTEITAASEAVSSSEAIISSEAVTSSTVTTVTASSSEPRKSLIKVPASSYSCEGMHYLDVKKLFEDAGFTDISVFGYEASLADGDNSYETVILVSVNDQPIFESDSEFEPDAAVIIYYSAVPSETEPSVKATEAVDTKSEHDVSKDKGEDGAKVTVPESEEDKGDLVWVPVNGGTKYHSKKSCSNMKDPIQVSIETAIKNGYTACKRCH